MRCRSILFVGVVSIFALLPQAAIAEMDLYMYDESGDTHQVQITPGQSFEVLVDFTTTTPACYFGYFLSINAEGSGQFAITDWGIPQSSPFPVSQANRSDILLSSAALLNPSNDSGLGAGTVNLLSVAPGTYFVSRVTISSMASVTPGTYTLSFCDTVGYKNYYMDLGPETEAVDGHGYTIVVTEGSGGGDTGNTGGDAGDGGAGDTGGTGDTNGTGDVGNDTSTTNDGTSTSNAGTNDQTGAGTGSEQGGETTTGGDTASNGTQTDEQVLGAEPGVPSVPICGSGTGTFLALGALMTLLFVQPVRRRR